MKIKVCYVVCYKDPEYIRTRTLLAGLSQLDNVEVVVVKNSSRGLFRYVEVPLKLAMARIKFRPDVFVVGFRGQDVFWLLYPSMIGKKIVFDEFVNLHDWLVNEHHKLARDSWPIRLIDRYIKWVIKKSAFVLEDTKAHAQLSKEVYKTPDSKLVVVPVGADEATFYPRTSSDGKHNFEVFFFGNMLPLHGLNIILEAIKLLAAKGELDDMHFTLAGGKGDKVMIKQISNFIKLNKLSNSISHLDWIPYSQLPDYIARADVCLGGPFGGTSQADRVVTGKAYQFIAMGKATVIGRNQASQDFIDKQNSLLVRQSSPKALADSIVWAKRHKKEIKLIGQNGKKLYDSHYSINQISKVLSVIIHD